MAYRYKSAPGLWPNIGGNDSSPFIIWVFIWDWKPDLMRPHTADPRLGFPSWRAFSNVRARPLACSMEERTKSLSMEFTSERGEGCRRSPCVPIRSNVLSVRRILMTGWNRASRVIVFSHCIAAVRKIKALVVYVLLRRMYGMRRYRHR